MLKTTCGNHASRQRNETNKLADQHKAGKWSATRTTKDEQKYTGEKMNQNTQEKTSSRQE